MKKILCLLALASAHGADDPRWAFVAGHQVTAASSKVTVQLPTNATRRARLLVAAISCPTAVCNVTTTIGGTLATATLGTTARTRTDMPTTSEAKFYSASNSTGGTDLPVVPLAVGTTALDMADIELRPGEAMSITVASSSQAITINVKFEEYSN